MKRTIQYIGLPILYLSLFILMSCGEIGGSGQCGGATATGACIRVEKIELTTSNVDALQDKCSEDIDTGEITYEAFTDHNAQITISNSPLPGASSITNPIITLQSYSISYSVNDDCENNTICPDLDPIETDPGQTITIAPESFATFTIPFVPLRKKSEFANKAGSLSQYPSYTANYTITGTDTFNNKISVRGHAEFTIGDYDNCS